MRQPGDDQAGAQRRREQDDRAEVGQVGERVPPVQARGGGGCDARQQCESAGRRPQLVEDARPSGRSSQSGMVDTAQV